MLDSLWTSTWVAPPFFRMSVNKLQLNIALESATSDDEQNLTGFRVCPSILIEGESISSLPIDLGELVESIEMSGEYFIYTCGCGVAECAGVYEGIVVLHSPHGKVSWFVPVPMAQSFDDETKVVFHRYDLGETADYRNHVLAELRRVWEFAQASGTRLIAPIHGQDMGRVMAKVQRLLESATLG
jgi:hypothetical protein